MPEEVEAFLWGELVEQVGDDAPEVVGFSEQGLELCEGEFDGIEVRGIGRQVEQESTGRLDGFAHPGDLVARQVVHDDDVAGGEAGGEHLLHIGLEGGTVHGAVQDHRRGEARCPQAGDEGGRLPVAPGDRGVQTPALQAAPPEPGHVGLGTRFIDKDKAFRLQPALPATPSPALGGHVGAFLFRRVRRFF